jgi:hypothetical protein
MIEQLNPIDPDFEKELSIQPNDRIITPYSMLPNLAFKILFPNLKYDTVAKLVVHLTERAKLIIKNNIVVQNLGNGSHTIALKNSQAVKRVLLAISYGDDNHLLR